jgi:multiple antibiotic resistance protein
VDGLVRGFLRRLIYRKGFIVKDFLLALVPIFVAVDVLGVLPMFMGLTEGLDHAQRRKIVMQSMVTASAVAVGFIFLGQIVFELLGITVSDFKVAGGTVLFIIAALDMLRTQNSRNTQGDIGAVPLGTPLIVGPAVLTTELILVGLHGYAATVAAVLVNIVFAGAVLLSADFWSGLLGRGGSRAISKVANLILTAIGVMMVRSGVEEMIRLWK